MTRNPKSAFTLAELLIVIAIVGVLLAILVPAVSSAWDAAAMTRCQLNLSFLWQAQNSRRADKGQSLFTAGGAWPSMLAPYLERSQNVFRCPLGPERPELAAYIAAEAEDPRQADVVGGGDSLPDAGSQQPQDLGFTLSDLTFRIYMKNSGTVDKAYYTAGQYLGTAFADSSYGVKKTDLGGGRYFIAIDDRMFFDDKNLGSLDYKDIQINVQLKVDRLTSIEFVSSDQGFAGSYSTFRFEVWLADEMISDDFVRDTGTVIGLDNRAGGSGDSGGGGTGAPPNPAGPTQTGTLNELAAIKAFDYGLNKGTYRVLDSEVRRVDPSLILILDYGKSVANYANKPPDEWPLYFAATEAEWMASPKNTSFLGPGETWWHFTALRHGGTANVLFCDGHIEILGPDALNESSPLWGARGR